MCVYMYIYIYTYTYIHIYTHIHILKQTKQQHNKLNNNMVALACHPCAAELYGQSPY